MTAFEHLHACPFCGAHRWVEAGGDDGVRCGECAHEYRAEDVAYVVAGKG